jgi:hypothetical protein
VRAKGVLLRLVETDLVNEDHGASCKALIPLGVGHQGP